MNVHSMAIQKYFVLHGHTTTFEIYLLAWADYEGIVYLLNLFIPRRLHSIWQPLPPWRLHSIWKPLPPWSLHYIRRPLPSHHPISNALHHPLLHFLTLLISHHQLDNTTSVCLPPSVGWCHVDQKSRYIWVNVSCHPTPTLSHINEVSWMPFKILKEVPIFYIYNIAPSRLFQF